MTRVSGSNGLACCSNAYGQETHLRFQGRGVSPTEGSCRFPLIVLQQTSLIFTGVKSRVLQLRTHRSLASASKKLYSRSTLPKWKLGQPRSISVRLILRETSYLSFRPPELGQPFWSFLLLVVSVQELKCLIPKFKLARNLTLPNSQNPSRVIQRGPSLIARYELALTGLVTNPTADRRTWRGEGS